MNPTEAVDVPAERAFAFVLREMGFPRADLVSVRRQAGLVRSRALFAWALRQHGVSYHRIARALARAADVIPAMVRVAEDLRSIDAGFAEHCARYIAQAEKRT